MQQIHGRMKIWRVLTFVITAAGVCRLIPSPGAAQTTPLEQPRVEVSAHTDVAETPRNQPVTLTVTLRWSGPQHRIMVDPIDTPKLTNLTLLESGAANEVEQQAGATVSTRTSTFKLQPIELGMAYIDGMIITYRDMAEADSSGNAPPVRLTTNRLEVKILPPVEPTDWKGIGGVLGLFVLAGIVVWGVSQRVSARRKAREASLQQMSEEIPLETELLRELRTIKPETVGDMTAGFTAITRILRRYCRESLQCTIGGRPLTDIQEELNRAGVPAEITNYIMKILESENVNKFSGKRIEAGEYQMIYTAMEAILQAGKAPQNIK